MKFRFLMVPVVDPQAAEDELNALLASVRVLEVERQFVSDGPRSGWALCVRYLVRGTGRPEVTKGRIDYREVLDEQQFAVYAKLRSLRKDLAHDAGVPAYALFTNEHLAAMVRTRASSCEDLAAIDGIGPARVKKYAIQFLEVLRAHLDGVPAT